MLLAWTGTGLIEFATERSDESATCTLAEALLLVRVGSTGVVSDTDAVFVMVVPEATPGLTVTTNVKVAVAPAARVVPASFVQAGVATLHVHPAGPVREKDSVFAGSVSATVMDPAAAEPAVAGPPFPSTWV